MTLCKKKLLVMVYIGCYVVHDVLNKQKRDFYKTVLAVEPGIDTENGEFAVSLDRGKLMYPTQLVLNIIMHTFRVFV